MKHVLEAAGTLANTAKAPEDRARRMEADAKILFHEAAAYREAATAVAVAVERQKKEDSK